MLPHVLQPGDYGTPVAALTIDGLALSSFNEEQSKWEIVFLRGVRHNFLMLAKKVNLLTGEIVDESAPVSVLQKKLVEFVVNGGSNRHLGNFAQVYFKTKPEFIGLQVDDSYDYRWMV